VRDIKEIIKVMVDILIFWFALSLIWPEYSPAKAITDLINSLIS
jgi:hypothetical protein